VCGVRPALAASANVSLLTRSEVKRLVTDEAGTTVKGVELVQAADTAGSQRLEWFAFR